LKAARAIIISLIFGIIGGGIVTAANNYINPYPKFYQFDVGKALRNESKTLLSKKLSNTQIKDAINKYMLSLEKRLNKYNKTGYVMIKGIFVDNHKVKDITSKILRSSTSP